MNERTCETCRWRLEYDEHRADCRNPKVSEINARHAKNYGGDCGPSGRYWEPKEEEE